MDSVWHHLNVWYCHVNFQAFCFIFNIFSEFIRNNGHFFDRCVRVYVCVCVCVSCVMWKCISMWTVWCSKRKQKFKLIQFSVKHISLIFMTDLNTFTQNRLQPDLCLNLCILFSSIFNNSYIFSILSIYLYFNKYRLVVFVSISSQFIFEIWFKNRTDSISYPKYQTEHKLMHIQWNIWLVG